MFTLRPLHLIGSSTDNFMFQVSMLYGKKCPYIGDYAIFLPNGDWYFIKTSMVKDTNSNVNNIDISDIDENLFFSNKTKLPSHVEGPMNFSMLMSKICQPSGIITNNYDLMIPHCFCIQGMTVYRSMFEDILRLPHPGPTSACNLLCQSKALTRAVLEKVGTARIPKGEILTITYDSDDSENCNTNDITNYPLPTQISLPFVVKAAEEDNSRGVSLCRTQEEILPAVRKAFSYGKTVVVEEFIDGRELRAGCLEIDDDDDDDDDDGSDDKNSNSSSVNVKVMSCKIEYRMTNYPIRREEDKITVSKNEKNEKASNYSGSTESDEKASNYSGSTESDEKASNHSGSVTESDSTTVATTTNIAQTKCDRQFITTSNTYGFSQETLQKVDLAAKTAHKALGCRDYSLFDFRIDNKTGEPYIIEACSFWTFTPVSAISLMLENSEEYGYDWKKVCEKVWTKTAKRRARVNNGK